MSTNKMTSALKVPDREGISSDLKPFLNKRFAYCLKWLAGKVHEGMHLHSSSSSSTDCGLTLGTT